MASGIRFVSFLNGISIYHFEINQGGRGIRITFPGGRAATPHGMQAREEEYWKI